MFQKMIFVAALMFFIFLAGNVVGETSGLINLKSAGIVFGGTLLSVLLAFQLKTIKDLIKSLHALFRHEKTDHEELIMELESLSRVDRMQGTKALEAESFRIKNRFLHKGIELVVDGYDRFEIRNTLEKHYELYFSRKESQVNILNTLAKLAPVFGFVGTIIGLIDVLNNMGSPTQIGQGMGLALLTTFYGLLFSNFLFLPLAKKLSEHVKSEATILNMILEGVMYIAEQKHSKEISHNLHSYLDIEKLTDMDDRVSRRHPAELDKHVLRVPYPTFAARK